MSGNDVLILGGTGFIGSALAKRLSQEGIINYVLGRQNIDELGETLPRCSTVIHLASSTTPGSSGADPSLELANLDLTLRLLRLMQGHPEIHLIFFSSGGTVYGNSDWMPIPEETMISPLSNYGAGKASQEAFCRVFRAQGRAVTILRPSNAYGPGQTLRHGFGLVRTMLEHILLSSSMEVWGDGENVRDFIYIDDVVEATVRLIDLPKDAGTYNLGSGIGYSVNQVKGIVDAACGKELKTIFQKGRGVDVRNVILDNSLLNVRLGWQACVGLSDGIARTWKWLKQS